jgi:hypothetical protein
MKIYLYVVIASLFSIKSISQTTIRIETASSDGVIFPKEIKELNQLFLGKNTRRYTASKEDVLIMEDLLHAQLEQLNQEYVKKNKRNKTIGTSRLPEYKRQYFGYIDNTTLNKMISVQFLHKTITDENCGWLKSYLHIRDAGLAYWGITFDTKEKRFINMFISESYP